MKSNFGKYVIYVIIGLGAIGLAVTLVKQPMQIVNQLVTIAVVGAIFYFIYTMVMKKRDSQHSSYRKAAKQSVKKSRATERKVMNTTKTPKPVKTALSKNKFTAIANKKAHLLSSKSRARNTDHLTVIEGNKGKKKNRISL